MWEFVIPATSTVNPHDRVCSRVPQPNAAYNEYVRQTAVPAQSERVHRAATCSPRTTAARRRSVPVELDQHQRRRADQSLGTRTARSSARSTFGVTEKLDLTVRRPAERQEGRGFQVRADRRVPHTRSGGPAARRPVCVQHDRHDDRRQGQAENRHVQVLGGVSPTDSMMVYVTYAEGFTSASDPIVTIGANSVRVHARLRLPRASQRNAGADLSPGRNHRQHGDRAALRLARRPAAFQRDVLRFELGRHARRAAADGRVGQHATVPVQHGRR